MTVDNPENPEVDNPEVENPEVENPEAAESGAESGSESETEPQTQAKAPISAPPVVERPPLPPQTDPKDLDISTLTPTTPEIIARQATINIGTIGHVAHGKSTVVKAISGVQTVRFKNGPCYHYSPYSWLALLAMSTSRQSRHSLFSATTTMWY